MSLMRIAKSIFRKLVSVFPLLKSENGTNVILLFISWLASQIFTFIGYLHFLVYKLTGYLGIFFWSLFLPIPLLRS